MIKAIGINKIFTQATSPVHAVRDASLEIKKGERVYVYGPSGAGKSTLLHVLGGLSVPTSGKVEFAGSDVYALGDAKRSRLRNRNFGFIFQFYYLLPELCALENVMLPAVIKGVQRKKDIRARATRLLESVGMAARVKHRSNQLSGGEIQRVAIARALVNSPEILFCDEPTGNLDSDMARQVYDIILSLSERSDMSVVVVSHQDLDKDFFTKEYFMKDGVIEAVADKTQLASEITISDLLTKGK